MNSDKKPKPNYYSIIPAEVRYCKGLGIATARDLYGEISALCNKSGFCFASNSYFSELYEVDDRTVRRWLSKLEKEGFVYSKVIGKRRKIFLNNSHKNFDATTVEEPEEEVEKDEPEDTSVVEIKKPVKEKKKQVVRYSADDLMLAEHLLSKIVYNFPVYENKKVNISEWAEDMRKLRLLNNAGEPLAQEKQINVSQILFMIGWIHGGEVMLSSGKSITFHPEVFWSKNILSASKFRKQFYELIPKAKATVISNNKQGASVQM